MTANELRIGNWVTYNPMSVDEETDIIPLQVTCIDKDGGVLLDDGFDNVYNFDEILPIPLTIEILEKCGFQNISNDKYWLGESYFFKDGRLYYFPFDCPNTGHADEIPPYLHWLQNHHFFTFKKELEINL